MHPRATEFRETAAEIMGEPPTVLELPRGTKTAADAAKTIGCDLAQIVKSLVMTADDELVMVLTSGVHLVDENRLARTLGVDAVDPATPETVKETLGWAIGGVPPFGHETSIDRYLDPNLLDHDEVWAGAGTPSAVFAIDPQTLVEVTDAEPIDAFEDG